LEHSLIPIRFKSSNSVQNSCNTILPLGRAVSQAVSRLPLTAEARVRAHVNQCEICGGESGTGTGYLRVLQSSPVNFIRLWLSVLM
jgi:hypothetical protein